MTCPGCDQHRRSAGEIMGTAMAASMTALHAAGRGPWQTVAWVRVTIDGVESLHGVGYDGYTIDLPPCAPGKTIYVQSVSIPMPRRKRAPIRIAMR